VLKLMAPALFGVSVSQINLLLDTVIASFLPEGSVSWLYYSDRLVELPLGVFGVAAATVILPRLSRLHSGAAPAEFRATLDWGLRFVLLIAAPATLALVLIAEPVLTALFYDGTNMVRRDIEMAAFSLRAFALGLIAFMSIKVLASGFYSRQDTRTPVTIGIVAMVANMVLNLLFVFSITWWLTDGDFSAGVLATLALHPGAHAGLALASSGSAWLNAALLWRALKRVGLAPGLPWLQILRVVLACLAMAVALRWLAPAPEIWLAQDLGWRAGWLAFTIAVGASVYALAALATGLRPGALRHRPTSTGAP
jgi:putative peptidoglycan lipid II flippase